MIELNGSQIVRASRPAVWQFLTTPEQVTPLVPQIRTWAAQPITHQFQADLAFTWAGKTLLIPSTISWYNEVEQWQAQMQVEGCSAQSTFTAATQMCLHPSLGQRTEIVWQATAVVTGKLAEVPLRVTKTAALLAVNQFFRALRRELSNETLNGTV